MLRTVFTYILWRRGKISAKINSKVLEREYGAFNIVQRQVCSLWILWSFLRHVPWATLHLPGDSTFYPVFSFCDQSRRPPRNGFAPSRLRFQRLHYLHCVDLFDAVHSRSATRRVRDCGRMLHETSKEAPESPLIHELEKHHVCQSPVLVCCDGVVSRAVFGVSSKDYCER